MASSKSRTNFVGNAERNWGAALPDWVRVLAEEANRSSGSEVARRLGYSPAVVTGVINGTYPGDMGTVEARVRGALMNETVDCPVLGELTRDRCLSEQKMRRIGSSSLRARISRACRSGCPHSRLSKRDDEGGSDVQS
ncbi:hypothetical protein CCR94_16485 [Rhodoblastus sphagnicola]|uniref:Transcriptional regulator n=1 Tax=Rhodoblastus sphagnicola TaxID=333368 RepID=A0A2S6N318_9HYPH|nr:transcriptional regulator [Rhodoblastus sphagnicola]MBB4199095.1 hypothetical protein [Rhodoblastus sphagnicola]PPQ28987.1 hypothetical protein CCR94_16485 [Rhodoblastus sphagnicola]